VPPSGRDVIIDAWLLGSWGPKGGGVTSSDIKKQLHLYLRGARETLVWKLEGLSEYDMRRPLTPTGTNLLGLVKHSTATHLGYFGEVFGRDGDSSPRRWRARRRRRSAPSRAARFTGDAEPNAEFWATPDESSQDIVTSYRAAWDVSDTTISELPLDAVGRVPWWGDATVTLQQVLVHVTSETQRHAGHADIVRELIDGSAGLLNGHDNLHIRDPAEQQRFREQVEAAASQFR
jgi:Protein of unknown function (DUF664)